MIQLATRPTVSNTNRIQLFGDGGNDVLILALPGYAGSDQLSGGPGVDFLSGGNGTSTLDGGPDTDVLIGNLGNDRLFGGGGTDVVSEQGDVNFTLTDTQLTGRGTDTLDSIESAILGLGPTSTVGRSINASAFSGLVNLYGSQGRDTLVAGRGGSYLSGQGDNDFLGGGPGRDILSGGPGNDVLYGRAGNDRLLGEGGDDFLWGDAGDDHIDGGTGLDGLYEDSDVSGPTITLSDTQLRQTHPRWSGATDTLSGIDHAILVGTDLSEQIDASQFNGTTALWGWGSSDFLRGGASSDDLYGGEGNDILLGLRGDDELRGENGRDFLIGGMGLDYLWGGADQDILVAGYTSYDGDISALVAFRAEWKRTDYGLGYGGYYARVATVSNGAGSLANRGYRLNAVSSPTVFDDGVSDILHGEGDYDLFFAGDSDGLFDRRDPRFGADYELLNPWPR
jgi:Ca2+-binding RTX toxin-like protein